jgi:hypothetical protein
VKVGAENRKKVVAAGVLLFVALLLFARMALVDSGPSASAPAVTDPAAAAPTVARTGPRRLTPTSKTRNPLAATLDPRLRLDLLKGAEDVTYSGTGRNIFLSQEEEPIPKPVQSAKLDKQPTQAPQPPPLPPIDLKFFGFASKPGQPRKVFLAKGEDVFIAGEGDIVDRRYKVVRIGPNSIDIQDVLSNRHESIPITQG